MEQNCKLGQDKRERKSLVWITDLTAVPIASFSAFFLPSRWGTQAMAWLVVVLLSLLWNCSGLYALVFSSLTASVTDPASSPASPSLPAALTRREQSASLTASFPLSKVGRLSSSFDFPTCLLRQPQNILSGLVQWKCPCPWQGVEQEGF